MKLRDVTLVALLPVLTAGAADYAIESIEAEERYETAGLRVGHPTLVRDIVSPGLLSETGMGVYRTKDRVSLGLARESFALPEGTIRFVHGIRLYDFGRKGVPAHLDMTVTGKGENRRIVVRVAASAPSAPLVCTVTGTGAEAKTLEVPSSSLPADVALYLRDNGEWQLSVTSLSDASRKTLDGKSTLFNGYWIDGYGYPPLTVSTELASDRAGAEAEVRVDNHFVGRAAPVKKTDIPCVVNPAPTFDPVKAGWPLVFADEFDGTEVDWSKWFFVIKAGHCKHGEHVRVDGKGVLEMEMAYGPDGKNLDAVSLRSRPEFRYGYFESRLKLTRQNGWWAAFWMYGRINSDPFVDGFEIDIFEDYYTRKITPEGKNRRQLDHNLHMYLGSQLKSWNYSSEYDGSLDDWITIGCKRTPFEISYYLNGKLIRSCANHANWSSVTFDAFNHALGNAPLCLILSQQVMSPSWPWFDKTNATFPEIYRVDYVRAYEMPAPAAETPRIAWRGAAAADDGSLRFFKPGDTMRFEVDALPAQKGGAKLKAVYLFDAGYLVGYKTEPPYVFDVTFTKDWFDKTAYMKPGRQNSVPDFSRTPHSFVAYVQDETGAVAETGRPIRRHPAFFNAATRPYEGKAQTVPGELTLWKYDEGGQGVAYFDATKGNAFGKSGQGRRPDEDVDCTASELASASSGEWVNYTVDIAEARDYRAELAYGTALLGRHEVHVLVDGQTVGTFEMTFADDRSSSWALDKRAVLEKVRLPAGRHVLSLYFRGNLNLGALKLK